MVTSRPRAANAPAAFAVMKGACGPWICQSSANLTLVWASTTEGQGARARTASTGTARMRASAMSVSFVASTLHRRPREPPQVLGSDRGGGDARAERPERVLDGGDDGRRRGHGAGLPDALDAERVQRARRGEVSDPHRRDLPGRGHHVFQQRLHPGLALVVVGELLVERAADPLGHAAVDLSLDDAGIVQGTGVAGDAVIDDRDLPRLALDLDDGDVGAAGEGRARRQEVARG